MDLHGLWFQAHMISSQSAKIHNYRSVYFCSDFDIFELPAMASWEEKYNAERAKYESLRQRNKMNEQKIGQLTAKINRLTKARKQAEKSYDADMTADIKEKVRSDPDAIKLMVRNKEIGINDPIWDGRTLLIISAWFGSYDLCQYVFVTSLCVACNRLLV